LRPTSKAQKLLRRIDDAPPPPTGKKHKSVPLLGCVAAGAPIHAIENPESLSLESYFGIDDNTFALEVRGDSMIDDDIHDGDYVVCQRAGTATDGQLVVALIDNENATLKRFYKEDSCVRLDPANEQYQPIYPNNCRIEAIVVGLVRKF
jgi:repressor LexA